MGLILNNPSRDMPYTQDSLPTIVHIYVHMLASPATDGHPDLENTGK